MNLLDAIIAAKLGGSGGGGSENAVLYVLQSLTDEQKAQARANIRAAEYEETVTLSGSSQEIDAQDKTLYLCDTDILELEITGVPDYGIFEFVFATGKEEPTVTLPDNVIMPEDWTFEKDTIYDISIRMVTVGDNTFGTAAAQAWPRPLLPTAYKQCAWIGTQNATANAGQYLRTITKLSATGQAKFTAKFAQSATSDSYAQFLFSCMEKNYARPGFAFKISYSEPGTVVFESGGATGFASSSIALSESALDPSTFYTVEATLETTAASPRTGTVSVACGATTDSDTGSVRDYGGMPIVLFADNYGIDVYGNFANVKLESFTVEESGELLMNLIPCYRKSDSVIGMYDTVNNRFYTNRGTGSFLKGADV